MKEYVKEFWEDEEGMGVVELVLIIAALVSVALLFSGRLKEFVGNLMDTVFGTDNNAGGNITSPYN